MLRERVLMSPAYYETLHLANTGTMYLSLVPVLVPEHVPEVNVPILYVEIPDACREPMFRVTICFDVSPTGLS